MDRKADYGFELPPAQIAQAPTARRDGSRLLIVGADAALTDAVFTDTMFPALLDHLPPDPVVVVNDARVVPARVRCHRPSGGAVELLFVEPELSGGFVDKPSPIGSSPDGSPTRYAKHLGPAQCAWRCLARAGGKLRAGDTMTPDVDPSLTLTVVTARGDDGALVLAIPAAGATAVYALLDRIGELPLPPYIARTTGPDADDRERYQTMFARNPGAVAAPTAGLHLTPALVDAITARGGTIAPLTLHVGLGTFAPIRTDLLAAHVMHTERFDIPAATAALVASGRPVVAIGTTVVRALESAATAPRTVTVGPGATALFVRPGAGFRFRVVDSLVTNFHLPESTLLMLVSAFAGYPRMMAAYRHAVAAGYRFFSYGDAMLCHREAP